MQQLIDALNAYSLGLKSGLTNEPITVRRVEITDILKHDKLVLGTNSSDVNKRIEAGCFESGNTFAITSNGDIVYTSAYILKRYFKIDFLVDKKILMRVMDNVNKSR